jgi:hypothetical protein
VGNVHSFQASRRQNLNFGGRPHKKLPRNLCRRPTEARSQRDLLICEFSFRSDGRFGRKSRSKDSLWGLAPPPPLNSQPPYCAQDLSSTSPTIPASFKSIAPIGTAPPLSRENPYSPPKGEKRLEPESVIW